MVRKKGLCGLAAALAVLLLMVVGAGWTGSLLAQEDRSVGWIYSDEAEQITKLPKFYWRSDGTVLLYDLRKPADARTFEVFDPETGRRRPLLDLKKAREALSKLLPAAELPERIGWPSALDREGKQAAYLFGGDLFLLNLENGRFRRLTHTDAQEKDPRFSPDGRKLAFVRDNNLFVIDLRSGEEKQITSDGSRTILNGTLSWVYWEEIFGRRDIGFWWSPDSRAIAYLRSDESPVSESHFIDFRPTVATLIEQRYPQAGGTNPLVEVWAADLETGKKMRLDPSRVPYEYVIRVKWLPDSRRLAVELMNRDQTKLDLYLFDRRTGALRHVLTETDTAWVSILDDLHFLRDGRHFLWASERTGYTHLYRYRLDGTLINPVTHGNWSLTSAGAGVFWVRRAVAYIDEKDGWVYFSALKKSSLERQLYRVRLDGTGMKRISKEDGTHRVAFSPDGRYYLDVYSAADTPPSLSLHARDGKLLTVLAEARTDLVRKLHIRTPRLFSVPARDGFRMPASLLTPADFDSSRRYPVIINVYGGPAAPTVQNAWSRSILFDQVLLRNGFLVFRADNRSATGISKKLTNLILRKMYSDVELNDLLDAVHWLKSQPYVDPARVGIWGWSGGGTFTLLAMTHSQEFKAGISGAPVTDWRYYDTKWAEAVMKTPLENPEGYKKTSLLPWARHLHGRLLILQGTYDDNVHPQNTLAFIDELIKAGKLFEMVYYPLRKHGFSDRAARIHRDKTMLDFWKRNL